MLPDPLFSIRVSNENIVQSKKFYNVYEIEPTPAAEVAKKIATSLKRIDQPGVAFYGDVRIYKPECKYRVDQNNPGDNIAHFAHLGGMLFGFLLIRLWKKR